MKKNFYLRPWPTGQLILRVVVRGDFFVRPLDDVVAKSHSNELGGSSNSKNPDLKGFLCVTNPFLENFPKRFQL